MVRYVTEFQWKYMLEFHFKLVISCNVYIPQTFQINECFECCPLRIVLGSTDG